MRRLRGGVNIFRSKRRFSPTAKFLLDHQGHRLRFLSENGLYGAAALDADDYVKLNDEDPNLAPEAAEEEGIEAPQWKIGHWDHGGRNYVTEPGQPERLVTEADDLDALIEAGAIFRRSEAFDPPRLVAEHLEASRARYATVRLMPPEGA
jgi:hypothetical protein